ncbi:MAG: DUF87 domain-containing protein [Rubricoccaceae bacterium]|nr:DUF87 domain-containing protein [Rubricoccaceae bacterium]
MDAATIEQTGMFYLGRRHDLDADQTLPAPVLYDAADLTTHAAIIGMTGSGKTGLGISLIEEAALDRVPVLAIDPKGDLANLLLTFPNLAPTDFEPWVNPAEAEQKGRSVDEHAAAVAEMWRSGLDAWDQQPDRIQRLRDAADVALYTPGSDAATPVALLRDFAAPPADAGADARREHVEALISGLLSLVGVEADPLQSPEHVFLAHVLESAWNDGRTPSLADLILALQTPPMSHIGVLEVDTFFPVRQRQSLAMRLNGLLASPSFAAWAQGEPLDVGSMLYADGGRPRVSVFSIAHLDDDARMFFVTRLLGDLIAWMRRQSGTSSLRALLYMDEVMGFLPPVSAPPSKTLFLTLLKQARAFGLGVVVSTQNPVDLDYKALSNCGTWLVGRLQTEQDKARLLDGLEGAAGGALDRDATDATLSRLGKRVFLLHNVHEPEPTVFHTRWAMSYLAGPLTRQQLRRLAPAPAGSHADPAPQAPAPPPTPSNGFVDTRPPAPAGLDELTLAPSPDADADHVVYVPMLLGQADVHYRRSRPPVDHTTTVHLLAPADAPDWSGAIERPAAHAAATPDGAHYALVPASLHDDADGLDHALERWIKRERTVTVLTSKTHRLTSQPGESEDTFRGRLTHAAREARDAEKAKVRERYASRMKRLEDRMARAEAAVERERGQAGQRKLETAIEVGSALLGAFLGGRSTSRTISSARQAARGAGRARKESGDVDRAQRRLDDLRQEYADLDAELTNELDALDLRAAEPEPLEPTEIKPSDVSVKSVHLAWVPHTRDGDALTPAL